MKRRPYQDDAIAALGPYFERGGKAPLIVTPTGSGKSVILAEFIREACAAWPDTHVLVITHVRELVAQDAKKIDECWPMAPLGVYSAGLNMRQLRQITVASIQSIYNKKHFYGRFDLIIVDEAHLIPHESEGMYRKLLDESMAANPHVKLIGLTATPYRLKGGSLHEGEGAIFDGIAYEANVADLIEDGYLCRLTAYEGDDVDLSGIRKTGGDFNVGQLGERMSAMDLVEHHAEDICKRFAQRKKWLGFAVTVEHAQMMTAAILRRGVKADYVHGAMAATERDEKIRAFKAGETRCLFNMGILTTGFDAPEIDAIACLRPTQSPSLYVQIAGRGTRPVYAPGFDLATREGRLAAIAASGKPNCLFADYGGNVKRHGFIDRVEPPRSGKGKGEPREAPVKACPQCGSLVAIMTKNCAGVHADGRACTHVFEVAPRENETLAHVGAMLSTEVPPVELEIEKVFYSKTRGKSGTPSLRADYYAGMQRVSEWVCVQHEGFARAKAQRWWRARSPHPMPETVEEAVLLSNELAQPRRLVVSFATKYPEILRAEF